VLQELALIRLEHESPVLALELIAPRDPAGRAELEGSASYRAYHRVYEDGRLFLNRAASRAAA
jgi:hypothetical protein